MFRFRSRSLVAVGAAAAATFLALPAWSANAPADPCALLPAAEVGKVLGREIGEPTRTVAPRPYKNTAEGTDCVYRSKSGHGSLLFRIYFDASPAESTDLFNRLHAFYGVGTSVPGVGDETYMDSKHGLHARKGNARFFLELNGIDGSSAGKDKPLTTLATGVASRL
jgi:hypothetical protein